MELAENPGFKHHPSKGSKIPKYFAMFVRQSTPAGHPSIHHEQ
jgi:hypothetical protein